MDREVVLHGHSQTPPLTPFLSLLVSPGQRDTVCEAPQLAGKVQRHHPGAGHGDDHDRGAVQHSRTVTAGRTLQQGEYLLYFVYEFMLK